MFLLFPKNKCKEMPTEGGKKISTMSVKNRRMTIIVTNRPYEQAAVIFLRDSSVKIDHVNIFALMTLAYVPVNVTALFHLGGAVRALDLRLLAALELRVPV